MSTYVMRGVCTDEQHGLPAARQLHGQAAGARRLACSQAPVRHLPAPGVHRKQEAELGLAHTALATCSACLAQSNDTSCIREAAEWADRRISTLGCPGPGCVAEMAPDQPPSPWCRLTAGSPSKPPQPCKNLGRTPCLHSVLVGFAPAESQAAPALLPCCAALKSRTGTSARQETATQLSRPVKKARKARKANSGLLDTWLLGPLLGLRFRLWTLAHTLGWTTNQPGLAGTVESCLVLSCNGCWHAFHSIVGDRLSGCSH